MKSLKRLVRLSKDMSFNVRNYNLLISIDKYGNNMENGINPFQDINSITGVMKPDEELINLKIIIFSTYIIEMYFAYANGKKALYLNTKYWITINQGIDDKDKSFFSTLYNTFNDIHVSRDAKLSSLVDLMLPIVFEQMELQTTYVSSYVRFFKIYGDNKEISMIFKEREGITLKNFISLIWIIFSYLNQKNIHIVSKKDFITYLSSTLLGHEEVNIVLNLISLTREEFQDKYFGLRKKRDGSWFDYSERESFDKGLPKVSYFYPLINNEDGTYSLISFTAYKEFMKLKSIYRIMTEKFTDIEFKSHYAGPLFEGYVKLLIENYNKVVDVRGEVGGNEPYYPNKKTKYDEPDILYDREEYLLAIECKSTPFALNLLQDRDPESLNRMKDDIKKSIDNINRYIEYTYSKGITKRVIKILVYYDVPNMVFSILLDEIRKYVTTSDFYIIDIGTLELLLMENLGSLPKLLDKYRETYYKEHKGDLNSYLRGIVDMQYYDDQSREILDRLTQNEIGLFPSIKR